MLIYPSNAGLMRDEPLTIQIRNHVASCSGTLNPSQNLYVIGI